MFLGSCNKFARWQHPAIRRGSRFVLRAHFDPLSECVDLQTVVDLSRSSRSPNASDDEPHATLVSHWPIPHTDTSAANKPMSPLRSSNLPDHPRRSPVWRLIKIVSSRLERRLLPGQAPADDVTGRQGYRC